MTSLLLVPALLFAIVRGAETSPVLQFTGEAVLRNIGASRVAVFLDVDGDARIDQGFLLSSDLPIASNLSVECPEARVDFTDGWARLSSGKKIFDLYVAGYPEPPATPEGFDATRFTGYALVHSSGNAGCTLQRALEDDPGVCYRYGED